MSLICEKHVNNIVHSVCLIDECKFGMIYKIFKGNLLCEECLKE